MVVKILDVPAAAAVSVCDTTQMWSRLWTLHVSVRGESGDLGVCVCVCVFRRDFSHMWWHYRETFKPRTSRKLTEFLSVGLQTVRLLFTPAQRTDLCVSVLWLSHYFHFILLLFPSLLVSQVQPLAQLPSPFAVTSFSVLQTSDPTPSANTSSSFSSIVFCLKEILKCLVNNI